MKRRRTALIVFIALTVGPKLDAFAQHTADMATSSNEWIHSARFWAASGLAGLFGSLGAYLAKLSRKERDERRIEWFLVFVHAFVGFSLSSFFGLLLIDTIGEVPTLGACGLIGHGAIKLSEYLADHATDIVERIARWAAKK